LCSIRIRSMPESSSAYGSRHNVIKMVHPGIPGADSSGPYRGQAATLARAHARRAASNWPAIEDAAAGLVAQLAAEPHLAGSTSGFQGLARVVIKRIHLQGPLRCVKFSSTLLPMSLRNQERGGVATGAEQTPKRSKDAARPRCSEGLKRYRKQCTPARFGWGSKIDFLRNVEMTSRRTT